MSDDTELRLAWDAMTPRTSRSREVFEDLVGRHRQAHRRYHGVRHIVWVIRNARALEATLAAAPGGSRTGLPYDPQAVTAAAFFHDGIYDPAARDNEERSATLADRQLAALGWSPARREVVVGLVRATAGHLDDDLANHLDDDPDDLVDDHLENQLEEQVDGEFRRPTASERAVLLDADLAVLGSAPQAYAAYVNGVRQEYSHLAPAAWASGRTDVLRGLLARTDLYRTDAARQWWDRRARANMTAELAVLDRLATSAG